MNTSRRSFLKTVAAVGAVATLPACVSATRLGPMTKDGRFPAAPNFFTSARSSVMISGGTITKNGQITDEVRKAHLLHYGKRKKILMVLHASIPERRDSEEKKLQDLFGIDGFEMESLHHWEGSDALEKIASAEAFFIGGGETFLLLRTLIETRQLQAIRRRVLAGVPYNGSSAGANVAGTVIGCTNDFPVVDVPSRASFGLLPVVINPHHPTVDAADYGGRVNKVKIYTRINPTETVLGLGNGAVARLHEGQMTIEQGPAFYYRDTEHHELKEGPVPELTALV